MEWKNTPEHGLFALGKFEARMAGESTADEFAVLPQNLSDDLDKRKRTTTAG